MGKGEGTGFMVREAEPEDGPAMAALLNTADHQSDTLLYESGERRADGDREASRLRLLRETGSSAVLVAETLKTTPSVLVGYCIVTGGTLSRNRHLATVEGLAVIHGRRGMGVGRSLLRRAESWARKRGVVRLDLGVMAGNREALALYRSEGFVEEGIRSRAFRVKDRFVDQIMMVKFLD